MTKEQVAYDRMTDALDNLGSTVKEMTLVEFENVESSEVNVFGFNMPDPNIWFPFDIDEVPYGRLKRTGNGDPNFIECAYEWNLPDGALPWHTHPHNEHFIVIRGLVSLEKPGGIHYKINRGQHVDIGPNDPHKVHFESDTKLGIYWWRNG